MFIQSSSIEINFEDFRSNKAVGHNYLRVVSLYPKRRVRENHGLSGEIRDSRSVVNIARINTLGAN